LANVILQLHGINVYLIWVAAAVATIWGFVIYFTRRPMVKPWRIMLIVTLALGVLQGIFGLTMVLLGLRPGGGSGPYYLHYVYGGLVIIAIPLTWLSFTTNGKNVRRDILYYSLAALVILLAAVRAWMTGPR